MLKRLSQSDGVRRFIGESLARYLTFVARTSRPLVIDPPDAYERVRRSVPFIAAMWHGQHFMVPFGRPSDLDVRVMISRSGDGEINAVAAARLGMGLIRASGGRSGAQVRKRGGVRGFLEMVRTLEEGTSVAMTADVPKGPARVAGEGIVAIAEAAGRPIVPVAFATSRRVELATWDRMALHLPFGRSAFVIGEPIAPPAGPEERQAVRTRVEAGLNTVTARAYDLVDRRNG
jgi:lysophospholipid acyltransferase (LPLAT)-like uncharacterized protein